MEGIESHYFVAMDVDLIPIPRDCHVNLVSTFSRIQMGNKKDSLFVLPAFSLFPETNGEYVAFVKKKGREHGKEKEYGSILKTIRPTQCKVHYL
jgi:hypothetical protein